MTQSCIHSGVCGEERKTKASTTKKNITNAKKMLDEDKRVTNHQTEEILGLNV